MHNELERTLDRLDKVLPHLGGNNAVGTSTITVNAGGVGIWVCATACLICLVVVVVGAAAFGFQIADHSRKLDRLDEYLSAIYMAAPHLKQEDSSNVDHHPDSGKD